MEGDSMFVTVIGAGNSGLAMAAHLTLEGHDVALWNRSRGHIEELLQEPVIRSQGVVAGEARIYRVTDDLAAAVQGTQMIFVTTPAFSHKELAVKLAQVMTSPVPIILNPGRTFGALEFDHEFRRVNKAFRPLIAEAQTIIYTCRKLSNTQVEIYALKQDVLLSTITGVENQALIRSMPDCLQDKYLAAQSMTETSIGNVGMILHCAPLLLNAGWTENPEHRYLYYKEGITPIIASFIEKMDRERQAVAERLGHPIESARDWMKRTYGLEGDTLYQVIQNNRAYDEILNPTSLLHRYITEDVPTGLVPLEAVGKELGLPMKNIGLIIDLASALLDTDFRTEGRNLHEVIGDWRTEASAILH